MDSLTVEKVGASERAAIINARPLFVDLDGTLIGTDLLHEGFIRALRRDPSVLFKTFGWIKRGLATFKHEIAQRAPVDAATLPYREAFVAWLIAERARGRQVILATASPEQWAKPVAEYLGCFDDVIASNATHNRKSSAKLAAIREWCQRNSWSTFSTCSNSNDLGHVENVPHKHEPEFDYCGDSSADRKLWAASKVAHLVGRGTRFRSELTLQGIACEEFAATTASPATLCKMLRPTLWGRDALSVLAPALFVVGPVNWSAALATALCFCAASSASFVINDLLDLDVDRRHATKKQRAIAAGLVPIPQAVLMIGGLLGLSGLGAILSGSITVFAALCAFVVLSTLYSLWLKPLPVFGVGVLASLPLLRVVAGCAALGVAAADWVLLALGLVFVAFELRGQDDESSSLSAALTGDSGKQTAL